MAYRVFLVSCIMVITIGVFGEPQRNDCSLGKAQGLLEGAVDLFIKAKEIVSEVASDMQKCPITNCSKIIQPPESPITNSSKVIQIPECPVTNCSKITQIPEFPVCNCTQIIQKQECPPQPEQYSTDVDVTRRYVDCWELKAIGVTASGVYFIKPLNRIIPHSYSISVYCDMETDGGGWTVFQRRGEQQEIQDFNLDWQSYKAGFGNMAGEFWLGNDLIYALTNQKNYTLRVNLKDLPGNMTYAEYTTFWIESESADYTLHISGYSGTSGDAMTSRHNGVKFSTKDRDNNLYYKSCAQLILGGWWYNDCYEGNLNGHNMMWFSSRGNMLPTRSEMMIRPSF